MGQTKIANRQISGGLDGWIPAEQTWTYASADDPTFTFTVAADVTTKYSAGMKIKLTQGTVKYFIITAVSTFSGGNTTITVYGGTDYDLANAAITLPYYSMVRSPLGFPMSPVKWSVVFTDTGNRSQASPSINVWYNISPLSTTIPIGVWDVYYKADVANDRAAAAYCVSYCTLSTANNSESDSNFTSQGFSTPVNAHSCTHSVRNFLALSSKTVYYLNVKTDQSSTAYLWVYGGFAKTVITATCAYL